MAVVLHAESDAIRNVAAASGHGDAASRPVVPPSASPWEHGNEQGELRALPLTVRQVRLTDVPDLRALDPVYALNQPDSQLRGYSAVRAGMIAALPVVRARRPAFVARAGDRLVGFVQFQPRDPDERWLVLAIGTAVGVYESDPVIEALLEHGVRSAGLRGVKRLYARAPDGEPLMSAFRRQAWTPYATETVYVTSKPRSTRGAEVPLRSQQSTDTWAIHQLYNAAVPKPVHDAEALTSHHWDVKPTKAAPAEATVSGWLLEDGHSLLGYVRLTASDRSCLLEFLYHPERTDTLPGLVESAIAIAERRSSRRTYCAVRGYQAELATVLGERGFQPEIEQQVLVKYTTATLRLPVIEAVPFQLEVGERIPQRVPTFLQGKAGDGATS